MQNFNHSGQNNKKKEEQQQQPKQPQQPQQPTHNKQALLTKALTNLDVVGSIIMIVSMFLGAFYKSDGGMYSAWYVPGYSLIFNSDYMLGTLLIVLPVVVMIAKYVEGLKKYDRLISLLCLAVTFIFVFVVKGQASTVEDGAIALGTGAIIYILGNIIGLIGSAASFFGYDINKTVNGMINKK